MKMPATEKFQEEIKRCLEKYYSEAMSESIKHGLAKNDVNCSVKKSKVY
jgi:hypothetical protein